MNITEVRVKLVGDSGDRLRAFCSVTFDGEFVVRDLKIIDGPSGPFVAMPSRKLSDRCPKCRHKNHLRARFCNHCGLKLPPSRVQRDRQGRDKLHADIAHPINSECRERIQSRIIEAFEEELAASQQPGYVPQDYDDYEDDEYYENGTDSPEEDEDQPAEDPDKREQERSPAPSRSRDQGDSFTEGIF